MKLKGKNIVLIPIDKEERDDFFELAAKSYGSDWWYDDEKKKKRFKKNFFKDWSEDYFNINKPEEGQCFWIVYKGEKIGQVNYNEIDKKNKKVELDIIIGSQKRLGKGLGTDALKILIEHLFNSFDINKIVISARANNPRAIKAYQKVGFKKEGLLREEDYFKDKFIDCIRFGLLRKDFRS